MVMAAQRCASAKRPRGCSSRVGYPLVGGRRQRHFDGTNSKPRKLLENAATPTTTAPAHFAGDLVHALLAAVSWPHLLPLPFSVISTAHRMWLVSGSFPKPSLSKDHTKFLKIGRC